MKESWYNDLFLCGTIISSKESLLAFVNMNTFIRDDTLLLKYFYATFSGSSLAVLPIDDCGRKSKTMPLLYAHTDTITDMEFSPFHDGLLATGSQDCLVSILNFQLVFNLVQRALYTVLIIYSPN